MQLNKKMILSENIFMIGWMKYSTYISIIFTLSIACSRQPSRLEQALALAGENRAELELALQHYRENKEEPLKYQAACFLIENMPGKYTLDTMSVASNQPYFDALTTRLRNNGKYETGDIFMICDSVKEHLSHTEMPVPKYTIDLKTITSRFLIRHIDRSFEAWHKYPWASRISFETFCRYVLPYQTREYYWDGSRDYFEKAYAALPDSVAGLPDAGRYINSDIQKSFYSGSKYMTKNQRH
jgi:hypothetical protein